MEKEDLLLGFSKLQGLGNDYLYIDCLDKYRWLLTEGAYDLHELAIWLSDRHFGAGADGLILICPPTQAAHFFMRVFNIDGSECQMCGNGIRSAVKFALDNALIPSDDVINVQTLAGILSMTVTRDTRGKVDRVRVDMGRPRLRLNQIPALIEGRSNDSDTIGIDIDLKEFGEEGWWAEAQVIPRMNLISMGNPHVIFVCKGDPWKIDLERIGRRIESDKRFPERINVHFAQFKEDGSEATLRTFERGSGITLASGTGSSALCVAGVLLQIGQRKLISNCPGGALQIEWPSDESSVIMTGPVTHVYDATVEISKIEKCYKKKV